MNYYIKQLSKIPSDIVWICNSIYNQFPTTINWAIALGFIYLLSQLNVKP